MNYSSSPAPNFLPRIPGAPGSPLDLLCSWELGLHVANNYRDSHLTSLTHLPKPPNSNLPGSPLPGGEGLTTSFPAPKVHFKGPDSTRCPGPSRLLTPFLGGSRVALAGRCWGCWGKGGWRGRGTEMRIPAAVHLWPNLPRAGTWWRGRGLPGPVPTPSLGDKTSVADLAPILARA